MRTALILSFLLGCGGAPKPAPDTPPPATASLVDCGKVAEHVAKTASQNAKLRSGATYEAIQNLVSTRCTTDGWSDDAKQCLFAIKTIQDGRACKDKMTEAQQEAVHADARALAKETAGPVEGDDHSGDWIEHVVEPAPAPATKS